jgi:hypothetical protein
MGSLRYLLKFRALTKRRGHTDSVYHSFGQKVRGSGGEMGRREEKLPALLISEPGFGILIKSYAAVSKWS